MSTIRIGAVGLLLLAFALSFSSVVRYADGMRAGLYDAQCRVSSDPDCFGPYRD